jgi:hypothetical protein
MRQGPLWLSVRFFHQHEYFNILSSLLFLSFSESIITLPHAPITPRTAPSISSESNVSEEDDIRLLLRVLAERRGYLDAWLTAQGLTDDLVISRGF